MRSVRLLRAFRVLRLFKRLNEIRKIISALGQSIFPVANAFVCQKSPTSPLKETY